ncbi:TetR/AcrR family transcriptional regulator [Streptomyces scopuliridis]|uniref:TetR/AcrR family transcriptional regulator n=1 Tax=Streptomyces scopuliridis TaxID=452529 RepID=UPI002DD96A95|nr:TetR/AcrR family transcriptional regulator [Streptomyces scopuliridis]WSB33530.1 TetR/AcrR family transcriptional regulator [Streptomyces scopuliridis]
MPTAREALLRSALAALADLPWSAIRMVDVASGAGVSRQTLYNEFGSKDGLARALMRREADRYLHGVERLLGERADAADRLVAVAEWTVGEARARPLLRALLTGCWGEWLPAPPPARAATATSAVPAQRRADAGPPGTADLVALVRDRSAAALRQDSRDPGPRGAGPRDPGPRRDHSQGDHSPRDPGRRDHGQRDHDRDELLYRCELAVRLALAHLIAPGAESVGPLVRTAVTAPLRAPLRAPLSAPSPRAGAR